MIPLEWYRNFVTVYRAGSVTAASQIRSLSQPAVSQQLASLESSIGVPLFERRARGMIPTARAHALYVEVFESIDRLDRVSQDIQPRRSSNLPFRLGTLPEYFDAFALPRLTEFTAPLSVSLGDDQELLGQLETGAVDAIVIGTAPISRSLRSFPLRERRYRLIAATSASVPPDISKETFAQWLQGQPWVSYSEERPLTRRFWQQVLGTRFMGTARLVVPDLRSVVRAVELGIGYSLVPDYVCESALQAGTIQELWPIGDTIPPERWHLVVRPTETDRPEVQFIANALK